MPQSQSIVCLHLVYSTKDRRPILREQKIRRTSYAYLGEAFKRLECPPILEGGVEYPIHLPWRFGRTMIQADRVMDEHGKSNRARRIRGITYLRRKRGPKAG